MSEVNTNTNKRKRRKDMTPEERKIARRKSRRRFLIGSGIVLGGGTAALYFGRHALRRETYEFLADAGGIHGISGFKPALMFKMQPDNTLELQVAKCEMGQGIFTGIAMLAAEELDIDIENISAVPSNSSEGLIELATGGSGTTSSLYVPIRESAATFRVMLKRAAAKQWGVDAAQVQTADGFVSSGSNRMSYIDVVNSTTEWDIPRRSPELRPRSSFKVVGTERPRIDLQPKVMGDPIYGVDAEMPNMLYANLLKCPYIEGTLKSMDRSAGEAVKGVVAVIEQDDLIAVVAENRYAAEMGKRALNAQWDVPHVWTQQELDDLVTVGKTGTNPINLQRKGNVQRTVDEGSGTVIEAEYRVPIGVHAHMEPQAATADVQADSAKIITGTQGPRLVRGQVARAMGLRGNKVEMQNVHLGGAFGRRAVTDQVVDAAKLSKIMERPVQLIWDREAEFLCGVFRPQTHHKFRAKISDSGEVEALEHNLASGDQGLAMLPGAINILGADLMSASHGATFKYEVENRETNIYHTDVPFQTGIWRAVGMFPNGFAVEGFMDEVAVAAGKDPFDLRLEYLQGDDEKVRRKREVLERLREESGWDTTPKAEGIGRGVAIIEDRSTTAAAVIEVALEEGNIKIKKVTLAVDPGVVVNPDGVRQQCEGCIMMGISATLYEETHLEDGKFSASNYHQYPLAMLSDTPDEINVVMLELADKISGIGEPPMGPIAPAIANAVFDLTGHRLRNLPLQKELDALI